MVSDIGIPGATGLIGTWLAIAFWLILMVASLSSVIRRLHDISISGWGCVLYWIPLVNLLLLALLCLIPGQKIMNKYGAPPVSIDVSGFPFNFDSDRLANEVRNQFNP